MRGLGGAGAVGAAGQSVAERRFLGHLKGSITARILAGATSIAMRVLRIAHLLNGGAGREQAALFNASVLPEDAVTKVPAKQWQLWLRTRHQLAIALRGAALLAA